MDIRTVRTRRMLFDALEQLMEKKGFADITVTEVCELSTVSRTAFYRNFVDKVAFLDAYLQSITERFLALIGDDDKGDGADDLAAYARQMHLALIAFLEAHPALARANMGRTTEVGSIDLMVAQIARGISERAAREAERAGRELPLPADFLGMFYSGGMVHTLRWWIMEGKPITAEELADHTMRFLEPYCA